MPAVKLSPIGNEVTLDDSGNLAVGWKLYWYLANTTTPENTYTDSTGGTPQTNPIILNARGEPANEIWLTQGVTYDLVIKDASDVTKRTVEDITGVNDVSLTYSEWTATALTPTFIGATQFSVSGNQTSVFQVGRRIRFTDGSGTNYGTVSASVYTPPAPDLTTVTVTVDSGGVIDAGIANLDVSILTATSPSVPEIISGSSSVTVTYANGKPTLSIPASALQGRLLSETFYGFTASTVTMTIASPCIVTVGNLAASLACGMPVVFTTTGALPTGITAGQTYYVSNFDNSLGRFNISATRGGANVNTSGSQSGTHTASNPPYNKATNNPTNVELEFVAGGAGGGGVANTAGATGAGGGAGEYAKWYGPASSIISGDVTLTIGAGGAAGASGGGNGGNGGNTTAAIFTGPLNMVAVGGQGGAFGAASAPQQGGIGGAAATMMTGVPGVFLQIPGGDGGYSISTAAIATSYSGFGGASHLGTITRGRAGSGGPGISAYIRGLTNVYSFANPGGGGSGAIGGAGAAQGGDGAAGLIIIREYS